jgi:hypothetical protein
MAALHPPIRPPLRHLGGRAWPSATPWIGERQLRIAGALTIMVLQFVGALGLVWDVQWHTNVGRDSFLTPPHILLYTGVAGIGVVCLGLVLLETWRAYSGRGVDDSNSVRVLGVFRAPIGFVLTGAGALITASAAPWDNYWHELYGIDVALWAPFHTMGSLGGIMGVVGGLYTWASLLVHERRRQADGLDDEGPFPPVAWGFLITSTLLLHAAGTQSRPALLQFPTLDVGALQIAVYPVFLALFVPWTWVLVQVTIGRRWTAPRLVVLWAILTVSFQALVPWLVRTGAAAQGFPLRGMEIAPALGPVALLLPSGFAVVGLLSMPFVWRWPRDIAPSWRAMTQLGAVMGLALWLLGFVTAWVVGPELPLAQSAGLPVARELASTGAMLLALPLALTAGIASVAVGTGLAQVLRRNPR